MKLTDFSQLLNERDRMRTLFDANGHLERDIIEEYAKNEENLKNEFFKGIVNDLNQNNIKNLSCYLGLLMVNPFNEEDISSFQKLVIQSIEKLENVNASSEISELANFVWVLLDHMLHNWVMNDEKLMIDRLKEFKVSLKKIELGHKSDVALLYQKLEHFGVE